MSTRPTPAEAKALWHSLVEPSGRKVAARFTAAGRPVSRATVMRWKRAGWARVSVEGVVEAAAVAVATMDSAVPALTGDVMSKMDDIVTRAAETRGEAKAAPPDNRSNLERAEFALRTAIDGATTVWQTIRDIAAEAARRKGGSDVPPVLLLAAPEGFAKLMMAASAAINLGTEGLGQISALRAEDTAAVPGARTVYPPGQGPYAESSGADAPDQQREYPSRATIEAIQRAIKEDEERG